MNDVRIDPPDSGRSPHDVAEDFAALRSMTARDPQSLEQVVRSARTRRPASRWEEWLMSTIRMTKSRPWLTTAIAGGLTALVLLVIPVSYERITGHTVTLAVGGQNLSMEKAADIARELKAALRVEHVQMAVEALDGGTSYTLNAEVPAGSGVSAGATARAFASGLTRMGYRAEVTTTPRRERVSGNVYAYARDRVIEVSLDGKSAAQIEAEIKQRFAEAGITDAQVSVTKTDGEDSRLGVKIKAERHLDHGQAAKPEDEAESLPQLVLKRNGAPVGGEGLEMRLTKMKSHTGETTLMVKVTQGGKQAEAKVSGSESMTDAALAAEIQRQLEAAGLNVTVKVKDGGIEIEPLKK